MTGARKFLVAVDSSETSAYACTWAITNLIREKDIALIFNSQDFASDDSLPTVDTAAGGEYAVPAVVPVGLEEEEKLTDLSKALVTKFMKQCAQAKIVSEGEIIKGDPGQHIVEETVKNGVDAVIMGTHNYGIVKRALLGSISDYVLHHSTVPVIIVRASNTPGAHDPLTNSGLSRTIVVAVDGAEESIFAFTWALQNLCLEADKLVILHVESPSISAATSMGIDQFGMEDVYVPPDVTDKVEVELRTSSEKLVEKFMKHAAEESKVHCEGKVVVGPTEEKVVEELVKLQADMVVVGTHDSGLLRRTFLGSVSDYLAHNSPCPVVVAKIPRGPDTQEALTPDAKMHEG